MLGDLSHLNFIQTQGTRPIGYFGEGIWQTLSLCSMNIIFYRKILIILMLPYLLNSRIHALDFLCDGFSHSLDVWCSSTVWLSVIFCRRQCLAVKFSACRHKLSYFSLDISVVCNWAVNSNKIIHSVEPVSYGFVNITA